jgi:hypothetical protein
MLQFADNKLRMTTTFIATMIFVAALSASAQGPKPRPVVIEPSSASQLNLEWIAPGEATFSLVAANGDVLLSGSGGRGGVSLDGISFMPNGGTIEMFDGNVHVATVDPHVAIVDFLASDAQVIARHVSGTHGAKAAAFAKLLAEMNALVAQNSSQTGASRYAITPNFGCDFGAGCACNKATLAALGSFVAIMGSATTGNYYGIASGAIAFGLAYSNETSACVY